jgi:hypothetical protein
MREECQRELLEQTHETVVHSAVAACRSYWSVVSVHLAQMALELYNLGVNVPLAHLERE